MNDAAQLAAQLKATEFKVEATMQTILHAALANSKIRTPVKTGLLRRSETTRIERGGMRGFLGTNVQYAPFVHNGTRFMAARPFFTQGIEDSRAVINRALQELGDSYFAKVSEGL